MMNNHPDVVRFGGCVNSSFTQFPDNYWLENDYKNEKAGIRFKHGYQC